jgi:hypothetical protein
LRGELMKYVNSSALALILALIGLNTAHALEVTTLIVDIPLDVANSASASIEAGSSSSSTTGAAMGDKKEAYFTQLREDSIQEVADGGAPTAVLEDAILQIRAQTGTTASDRDLALAIVQAMN